jgi:hypothetical protein
VGDETGVIVLVALVDHGAGPEAKKAARALTDACVVPDAAREALLAALSAATPRGLSVTDLSLALANRSPLEEDPSVRGAPRVSSGSFTEQERGDPATPTGHPSARARAALLSMGAGSFNADTLMDGSVHGGNVRGDLS